MFKEKNCKKVIWINPREINDVEKRGQVIYPRGIFDKSDYTVAALWIQKYKTMIDAGIPKEKCLEIQPIAMALEVFFKKMVRVIQINGQYYLGDDGRHRVKAAQDSLYCQMIPVLLVEER